MYAKGISRSIIAAFKKVVGNVSKFSFYLKLLQRRPYMRVCGYEGRTGRGGQKGNFDINRDTSLTPVYINFIFYIIYIYVRTYLNVNIIPSSQIV